MNFKLIYISPNGSTKTTSEVLKSVIEKAGHSVEMLDIGDENNRNNFYLILQKIKDADIVGFGSPAYHMDMLEPMKRFLDEMQESKVKYHFKAFLYLNYAGITSGMAFINTAKKLKGMGVQVIGAMRVVAPHFHHKEKFPIASTEAFIDQFYNKMQAKSFRPIPWNNLFEELSKQKVRVRLVYPLVHLIGKKRELKIHIRKEKCICCKRCERECPVGAISISRFEFIDSSKCIHCYHCTIVCRLQAIEAPVEKLDKMIKMNKKIIGIEKPQNYTYI